MKSLAYKVAEIIDRARQYDDYDCCGLSDENAVSFDPEEQELYTRYMMTMAEKIIKLVIKDYTKPNLSKDFTRYINKELILRNKLKSTK